jgi:hypothetical protein
MTLEEKERKLLPCMPYLHGDVAGDQFRAACRYEYARESKTLRDVAELFRRSNRSADKMTIFLAYVCWYARGSTVLLTAAELFVRVGEGRATKIFHIFHQIYDEFPAAGKHLIKHEWRVIWQCPSFPAKSWNDLSKAERSDLLWGLPNSTKVGHKLTEALFLQHSLGLLEPLFAPEWKAHVGRSPYQKVYPILALPDAPFVLSLLVLDFSKSKKRVRQEIDDWLELPENKARFDKHKPRWKKLATKLPAEDLAAMLPLTEDEAKDRLKDLAAWKVYLEHERDFDKAIEFTNNHRLEDKGNPRPFHDHRQGQTKKADVNRAPLYSERTGFQRAGKRVKEFKIKLLRWER